MMVTLQQLDPWQKKVLETKGNIVLRSGRQNGKSTVIAVKAAIHAIQHSGHTVMILSCVERQAYLLFDKVLAYLLDNHKWAVLKGKDRPTKSRIKLKNKSVIYCLPAGLTGAGIRGFTVNLLIVDEAAFVEEAVFDAITPMLSITKGDLILLSTPFGRRGYFYDCFSDDTFTKFHISAYDCPRHTKEFLEQQKKRMTRLAFTQEYLGEFVDELMQLFPTDLIKKCMTLKQESFRTTSFSSPVWELFGGCDVARLGGDETTIITVARYNRERVVMVDMWKKSETLLTEVYTIIKNFFVKHKYKKFYMDDAGVGAGVFDFLIRDRLKVVGLNNATRSIDRKDRRKKLLKEDMYTNLLMLMEKAKVDLIEDPDLLLSLKSVQYEYTKEGNIKIFGEYTHLAEALIRACWCMKDESLTLWAR